MRVLGIDPGSVVTGFGVVDDIAGRLVPAEFGTIRTDTKRPVPERLRTIRDGLVSVIDRLAPDEVAIESVFVNKNVESALKLGQARGVCLLAAAERGLSVHEYAPAEVKGAVAGHGRAEKSQIGRMIRMILHIEGDIPVDAADALAVAVCHLQRARGARRVREARL
jgi:crossover junction endodeoxyribonuclease RuvC